MAVKSRRRLLKGLAVTLPAAWSRPVVEAVVLPAHAQTSTPGGSTPVNCSAPAGCYGLGETVAINYFFWLEDGPGPREGLVIFEGECFNAQTGDPVTLVVAASAAEAASALGCEAAVAAEVPTSPALSGGCAFYACVM